ncbi:putative toxin-antitoxin system toxin component, PIN family [Candidatus Microgenomates bacterium]|nr:putative toxin-antitoxin system toxin component, PIN family [Candidatus Microgenomates bacterium]
MTKRQKNLEPKVLFNASVVLSGLRSPNGGSGKLLDFVGEKLINGQISEIILDEILKHSQKLGIPKTTAQKKCLKYFEPILSEPGLKKVDKYTKKVIDEGDAHVLASYEEGSCNYLVTLDKKHLLSLKGKIKGFNIYTPGELIQLLKIKI